MVETTHPTHPSRTPWGLLAGALALLGALLAYGLTASYRATLAREEAQLAFSVRALDGRLGERLQALDAGLQFATSQLPRVRQVQPDVGELNERLRGWLQVLAGVQVVLVVDRQGRVVASSDDRLVGQPVPGGERHPRLRDAAAADRGRLHLSAPFGAPPTLSLARVVPAGPDIEVAYVEAVLQPGHVEGLMQEARHGLDDHLVWQDGDGRVLAQILPSTPQDEGERLVAQQPMGVTTRLSGRPMQLRASRDRVAALGEWRRALTLASGLYVLLAGVAVAGLAQLQRRQRAEVRREADRQAERQQTEALLRQSEERLRLAAEAARFGIFETDLLAGATFWSRQGRRILGAPAGAALPEPGGAMPDFIHPDDAAPLARAHARALDPQGEGLLEHRFRIREADGRLRWIYQRGRCFFAGEGAARHPVRLCGVVIDATEEQEQVHAREQELAFRRALLDSIPGALFLFDAQGHYLLWNRHLEAVLGVGHDDLAHLHPLDTVAAQDHARASAAIRQVLEEGHAAVEVLLQPRRGEPVPYAITGYRFEWEGRAAVLGVGVDISERRTAEAELRQHRLYLEELVAARTRQLSVAKESAEAANRAKSTFLANMSHELRSPMNAVMGLTELLLRHAADPHQRQQLSKIAQASRHLLGVINDILDISKIEAERLRLEATPFRLGTVLDDLDVLTREPARAKSLDLVIARPPALLARPLVGDPLRLGQILLNLTGNAVKFTESGSVRVDVRLLAEDADGLLLRFEVHDTGIGIAPEARARLFTAFEQGDGSLTRRYGGTGLGLVISKRLAELMGGQIGVDSAPGQGSTFWFTVRLLPGPAQRPGAAPVRVDGADAEARLRACHSGARLLLAEDEPVNQEVTRELLAAAGLQVDVADDGEAAVAMARHTGYALILMDLQMPRLNGLDAARAIRALPGGGAVPIVAMTANAFEEDRQRALAAGMNDHLAKPVEASRLYQTVLHWLSRAAPAAGERG